MAAPVPMRGRTTPKGSRDHELRRDRQRRHRWEVRLRCDRRVPAVTRAFLLWMAWQYSDESGKRCWPGEVEMARRYGCCERTVRSHVLMGERWGHLDIYRAKPQRNHEGRWHRRRTNRYYFPMAALQGPARPTGGYRPPPATPALSVVPELPCEHCGGENGQHRPVEGADGLYRPCPDRPADSTAQLTLGEARFNPEGPKALGWYLRSVPTPPAAKPPTPGIDEEVEAQLCPECGGVDGRHRLVEGDDGLARRCAAWTDAEPRGPSDD